MRLVCIWVKSDQGCIRWRKKRPEGCWGEGRTSRYILASPLRLFRLLFAVKSSQNTVHHLMGRQRCGRQMGSEENDALEEKTLGGIDWGLCGNRDVCLFEKVFCRVDESSFAAVVIDIDIKPRTRVNPTRKKREKIIK